MKIHRGGEMKKVIVIVLLLGAGVIALWGCGGGPGSPGSTGSDDTGVSIDAAITSFEYNGANKYSVDVVQQVCSEGPPPVFEFFADHSAIVTINARLLNPNTTFQPAPLTIEKYTIQYRRSPDSIGAPPIESDTRFRTLTIVPPLGTSVSSVTLQVVLVDLIRKIQYKADEDSGQFSPGPFGYLNTYTAIYTFEGKNAYGKSFSFQAQTDFQIGSFDYCQ
jgi:hypothetical protein